MGNQIKKIGGRVGQIIQYYDSPENWTQGTIPVNMNTNVDNIKDLNVLLSKNIFNLGCKMEMEPESIVRNGPKIQNCLVRGKITVQVLGKNGHSNDKTEKKVDHAQQKHQPIIKEQDSQKQSDLSPDKKQQPQQNLQQSVLSSMNPYPHTRTYNIVLSLSQIYDLKHMLSAYTKQQTQVQQKRNSSQGKICVICLDSKPEQALPCAHQYCKKCIQQYVIKNGLKCPMCRKSYRESLANNVYQIVEWNEDFVQEMRDIFFGVVEKNNAKETKKIRKKVQANDKLRNNS